MRKIVNAPINKLLATLILIFIEVSVQSSPTTPLNNTAVDDDANGFIYHYEIYKSAAIVTWNQSLDSTYCIVYSKDYQRSFCAFTHRANANNRRTFVIPLKHFELTDFPLSASLKFFGSNFTYTDSLIINL